ncbi:antiterminator Q family protein [Mannheimia sp. HC-2023]|uniref:antiterminator Q family protein n=1 Tax=Mannheimia indoligenes TaxID=3103145 RepID=UPI002FE5A7A4
MLPRKIKNKWLEPKKQEWIEELLRLWGAWEFSGLDLESRVNMIYRLMKSAEGEKQLATREACSDELGRLLNEIFTVVTKRDILLQDILKQKYWFGRSERQIAIYYQLRDSVGRKERRWKEIIQEKCKTTEKVIADILEGKISSNKSSIYLKKYQFRS